MKRFIRLAAALTLCAALVIPAFADTFVPSISYKPAPEIEEVIGGEEDLAPCIIVTTIPEAREKTTDIYQETRDELLRVYEELSDGTMELPLEEDYVIRELIDISFRKTDCIEEGDKHDEWLAEEDTTITIVFDLKLNPEEDIIVMVYIDDQWLPVPTVINPDGTATCIFEDFCPVVFCVEVEEEQGPVQTGDTIVRDLALWVVLMVASAAALILLLVFRRKERQ